MEPLLAAACRQDPSAFVAKAFGELNPGASYHDNWHIHAMTARLEQMRTGPLKRLVITMPPRLLKSTVVSCAFAAFLLGHDPATRIIITSYAEPLAQKLAADTQRIMEAAWYQQLFPGVRLRRQTRSWLETDKGGSLYATSVGGSVTGLGADWIIVDDPNNAADAYSEPARETVKRYFDGVLSSRLNDQGEGRIVVVMQRLHQDDLAGHLLDRGGWGHLKLSAIASEDAHIDVGHGRFHAVVAGDPLQPSRLSLEVLQRIKQQIGSRDFNAQYLQEPVPAEGNMVKAEWIQRYGSPPSREAGQIIQSWDTAVKTDPQHDYSVCTTWLKVGRYHYLLEVWRGKVDFPGLRAKVCDLYHACLPQRVIIEDAGSGASLIQDLKANSPVPAIGWRSQSTKEARFAAASVLVEQGLVLLPKDAPWLADFEAELLAFPGVRHDDQIDSFSQYAGWVLDNAGSSKFEVDWGLGYSITADSTANHILNLRSYKSWLT